MILAKMMKISLALILLIGSVVCYMVWMVYLEKFNKAKSAATCPPHLWKEVTQGTDWSLLCAKCEQKPGHLQ
jgi:hypothetical protein